MLKSKPCKTLSYRKTQKPQRSRLIQQLLARDCSGLRQMEWPSWGEKNLHRLCHPSDCVTPLCVLWSRPHQSPWNDTNYHELLVSVTMNCEDFFFSYCLHSSRTTKQKSQHGIRSWKIKENNQQRKMKAGKRGFIISKLNKISVQPWLSFPAWQSFKDFTSSHAVHVP